MTESKKDRLGTNLPLKEQAEEDHNFTVPHRELIAKSRRAHPAE
jgi:hypothetical protein